MAKLATVWPAVQFTVRDQRDHVAVTREGAQVPAGGATGDGEVAGDRLGVGRHLVREAGEVVGGPEVEDEELADASLRRERPTAVEPGVQVALGRDRVEREWSADGQRGDGGGLPATCPDDLAPGRDLRRRRARHGRTFDLGSRLPDHSTSRDHRPRRADSGRAQEPPSAQPLVNRCSSLAVPAGGHGGTSSSCPPVHERPDSTASAPNPQVREDIVLITTHGLTHRDAVSGAARRGRGQRVGGQGWARSRGR